MFGPKSVKTFLDEKLVTPQKNTAAIAIIALGIAVVALVIATHGKGK
jgi:hypothetical protein